MTQGIHDSVRRDFIAAYIEKWNCTQEYAEGMLRHVEIGASREIIDDFLDSATDKGVFLTEGATDGSAWTADRDELLDAYFKED